MTRVGTKRKEMQTPTAEKTGEDARTNLLDVQGAEGLK